MEYFSDATEIIRVPKESFIPSPKVESEVIKLEIRKAPKISVEDEKFLFDLVQRSFTQKEKNAYKCFGELWLYEKQRRSGKHVEKPWHGSNS